MVRLFMVIGDVVIVTKVTLSSTRLLLVFECVCLIVCLVDTRSMRDAWCAESTWKMMQRMAVKKKAHKERQTSGVREWKLRPLCRSVVSNIMPFLTSGLFILCRLSLSHCCEQSNGAKLSRAMKQSKVKVK